MNVLFQSRIDLFDRRGGDTIQMEKTAEELRKLDVGVDIDNSPNLDLSCYDLVHLFNIDWSANVYLCARNAKKQGVPIVFSPIHHSFQEIERYEQEARYGLRRVVDALFIKREGREMFKDICRAVVDPKKIPSTLVELQQGIGNEQSQLLKMADLLFVQTESAVQSLKKDFAYNGSLYKRQPLDRGDVTGKSDLGWLKVVNGVASRFAKAQPDWFVGKYDLRNFILNVGRIEPRKNQLAVIEAVRLLRSQPDQGPLPHSPTLGVEDPKPEGFSCGGLRKCGSGNSPESDSRLRQETDSFPCRSPELVFVGKISWRHPEYALRFKTAVRKCAWVYHIERIPYEKMASCYAAARVHVLASWFETTGLVTLEAALAGVGVVSTTRRIEEYLGNFVCYCDPGDIRSIARAIASAGKTFPDKALRESILRRFTWKETAKQTFAGYKVALGR